MFFHATRSRWCIRILFGAVCGMPVACAHPRGPGAEDSRPSNRLLCGVRERERLVCEGLSEVTARGPGAMTRRLVAQSCEASFSALRIQTARVVWRARGDPKFIYSAVVLMEEQHTRGPLVPRDIQPYVSEWPCPSDSACALQRELPDKITVSLPVIPACRGTTVIEKPVLLNAPPARSDSCLGWSQIEHVWPRDWCARAQDATTYQLWVAYSRGLPRLLGVRAIGDHATVETPGLVPRSLSSTARTLMERLEGFWKLPPRTATSCRDGVSITIAGRRAHRWKTASISGCGDPLGVLDLLAPIRAAFALELAEKRRGSE